MGVISLNVVEEADELTLTSTVRRLPAETRRIPDRFNGLILAAQIAAIFTCFWAASAMPRGWGLAALAGAFALLMVGVYSIIHEAEHGCLFTNPRLNVVGGVISASFFPAPFHLIRQGHIGHHLRNRSDDEAFDLWFQGESPVWKWTQWIGVLTGVFYVTVVAGNLVVLFLPFLLHRRWFAFDRPSRAFMDALNPKYGSIIRAEAIGIIGLHALIVWLMNIPLVSYISLYAAFGILWSGLQYVHHYGTERHITRGARNLRLWWPVDKLWLNHNWHRVHHEHPTISWIHLERIGKAEGDDRAYLPMAYLRMWSGPRKATTHVENLFAGKVIR
ncbi:MAG TPA: fatty acid desaturase [Blastocatellia bacterium]|nr:fatty acid desaturase [Blastocatellia bacterium]